MELNITSEETKILMSPVFIVGAGRSGTTWLQRLILEHPDVTGGQESGFFLMFAPCIDVKRYRYEATRTLGMFAYWDQHELKKLVLDIWKKTFISMLRNKPDARILLEKTPSHAKHMDAILELFPEARFIHIIRDSRAVVASMNAARKGWGRAWAPGSTKKAAFSWLISVNAARRSGNKMTSKQYFEVHYEDLLTNTYSELSRIYDYIGLQYTKNFLEKKILSQDFENQKSIGGTGLKDWLGNEIKEPIGFFRKGGVDAWKKDLNFFQKIITLHYTRKLLRKCGYNFKGRE